MFQAKHEQCPLQPLPFDCCTVLKVAGLCFALLWHAKSTCIVQLMTQAVLVQGWLLSSLDTAAYKQKKKFGGLGT